MVGCVLNTNMKSVTFRPLRRIKKTGKITVASYMQWRKVMTSDYYNFNLLVNDDYKKFPEDEFVYNHRGEQLFWYNHTNPESLPRNYPDINSACKIFGVDKSHFEGEEWKFKEPIGKGFHWSVRGFDCDGVPTFSHYDANHVASHNNINDFEPLTVGMVAKWYGWFLWQLNNSNLNNATNK
jgi:hypothetical protein